MRDRSPDRLRRGAAYRSCGISLAHSTDWTPGERAVIDAALGLLDDKLRRRGKVLELFGSRAIRDFVRLHLGLMDREVFAMVCLDAAHRMLGFEVLAVGCTSHVVTYPRQAARQALAIGAVAIVLVHNHPTGAPDASPSDRTVTATFKAALDAIGVDVLDHLIVSDQSTWSMRAAGLMP